MILRIFLYYVLTFFFTMLLGGLQQELGFLPQLMLAQWGPGIAGLLMLLFFRKDKHSIKFEFKQDQLKKYLQSIGYPLLVTGIAIAFYGIVLKGLGANQLTLIPSAILVGSTLFGAIGEEIGWRGFLQPTLNKKMNLFWSSVVTAALWAPWHINNFTYGLEFTIGFILVIFGYTFFISFLIKDTRFNLLIAVLFHWWVNLANSVVPTSTLTNGRSMLTIGIIWAIAAMILALKQRKTFKQKA